MTAKCYLKTHLYSNQISLIIQFNSGAGDSVSLSAINERTKHKPLLLPPSPCGTQNSSTPRENDENLYENAFGPGHPQYLNELRRLKPDLTRMSARLTANRRVSIYTTINFCVCSKYIQLIFLNPSWLFLSCSKQAHQPLTV